MAVELTVHTMPLELLRARAREAQRLIAQAREIARASFESPSYEAAPPSATPPSVPPPSEGADPSRRVGLLLDAMQSLLPGMPPLIDEMVPSSRSRSRTKKSESSLKRVTLRGGAARALDAIERAQILEEIAGDAAGLVAEIERRSGYALRAAEVMVESRRASRGF
jgi:hypothetical protein